MSSIPADIKPEWHNVIRHIQGICSGNQGYAKVTFTVIVRGNEPLLWEKGTISQIQPMVLSQVNVSPTMLNLLAAFMVTTVDGGE